jgi:hypothetical protein
MVNNSLAENFTSLSEFLYPDHDKKQTMRQISYIDRLTDSIDIDIAIRTLCHLGVRNVNGIMYWFIG